MARQTGKSFTTAEETVADCIQRKTTWVTLSAGERQALEWLRKAKEWAEVYKLVIDDYVEERDRAETILKSAEIIWSNGSRSLAIPSNPSTARGYSANLLLDEFAFHENPNEIWRAIYPSISNPLKGVFKIRIVSTANGRGNKFYDLWTKNEKYSKHFVDIYTAVKEGLPLNIEELKEGLDDPEAWAQEYECQFIDAASILFPYDLIATCESEEAIEQIQFTTLQLNLPLYLGIDIGRKKDLTVIWYLERVGDVLWTRGVVVLDKMPFREQFQIISAATGNARRVCIDGTGIGAQLAEDLIFKHGGKVEACQFTADLKNEIFNNARRKFDDRLVRIPISRAIREDLHAVEKVTTSSGLVRYQAARREDGHSDRATALALAIRASDNRHVAGRILPIPFSGGRMTFKKEREVLL
jgi:phage FluMu gp28-like protein